MPVLYLVAGGLCVNCSNVMGTRACAPIRFQELNLSVFLGIVQHYMMVCSRPHPRVPGVDKCDEALQCAQE